MSLATIRAAVKTALDSIDAAPVRAHAYEPDEVDPPAGGASCYVVPVEGTAEAFEHEQTYTFGVVVLTGPRSELERSQASLDAFLELGAVQTVLNGDLDGAVSSIAFQRFTNYSSYEIGSITYIGATLEFEVYA